MTPIERRTRQYRVTHLPTGIVTVVQGYEHRTGYAPEYEPEKYWICDYEHSAEQAGLHYGADVSVTPVPIGQEIPLPWGLPLVLRPRVA